MKKLTKKQARILQDIKDSLEVSMSVMADYHEEKNHKMVSHCQRNIDANIDGIMNFLIYSDGKTWDALKDLIWEIKNAPELHYSYAMECID